MHCDWVVVCISMQSGMCLYYPPDWATISNSV